ncbi:MAG: YraN family protein [Anaerolineales bacterium]|nr:YraN family protein [Anaerolineales bacterium]
MGKIKRHNQSLGRWGEDCAARYLEEKGYSIVGRNVRTPFGEIDLLAQEGSSKDLIFVEVKTRASTRFGPPEISVNKRKQEHIIATILSYFQEHPEMEEQWRVDIIAVEYKKNGEPATITHFENAIQI